MKNEFIYSLDNKRYHTWNYYLKTRFDSKVFKVPLNASFGCPNRDGTCGSGGCTFCGSDGSGEQIVASYAPLHKQYEENVKVMQRKWPHGKAMAYFQAYTNTYCSLATLQATINPFFERDDVIAISVATRADCLEDEKIEYLNSLTNKKEIWIELGLQTIHDETANYINRGHSYQVFKDCVDKLSKTNLKVCVHIMNSLPNESEEMMIETAKRVGSLPIHAIKIHMLYVSEGTMLAKQYKDNPFPLLTLDEYVDVVIRQLEWIDPKIVIQRLTGDGDATTQIAPQWTFNKTNVLNSIDKEMVKRKTYQGIKFKDTE